MTEETRQESLFESKSTINNNPNSNIQKSIKKEFTPNFATAFGVTKRGLFIVNYNVLENIFYGIHNLEIPMDMLTIEDPSEILANYFAAGNLKRNNLHHDPNIPHDFLQLISFLNNYSYKNGFTTLAHNFRDYFNKDPGKQKERLSTLEQTTRNEFVESFFSPYRPSNKDVEVGHKFYDPNHDGKDRSLYVDKIYEKFKNLSIGVKEV